MSKKIIKMICALLLVIGVKATDCDFSDVATAGLDDGCSTAKYKCLHNSGRRVDTASDWVLYCPVTTKCTCKDPALAKGVALGESCTGALYATACHFVSPYVANCYKTDGSGAAGSATDAGTCLIANTKAGCRKAADCQTAASGKARACYSASGIEVTDSNAGAVCHDAANCICREYATADNESKPVLGACTAAAQCHGNGVPKTACYDPTTGAASNPGNCLMKDTVVGCFANAHCQSQLCVFGGTRALSTPLLTATSTAPLGGTTAGGTCKVTGGDGEACAFYGEATKYPTGCSSFNYRCVTTMGLIIPDKATFQSSRCKETPSLCTCKKIFTTFSTKAEHKTAGVAYTMTPIPSSGDASPKYHCVSKTAIQTDINTMVASAVDCADAKYCVCLIPDHHECTSSDQCLPTSSCYHHQKTAEQGALLGLCLNENEARDSEVLDKIENFDSVTLINKMSEVETNVKAKTDAKTDALETSLKGSDNASDLTTLQTAVSTDIAAVKADVKAVDAKVALESTAEKVKKDLGDTKDAVGDYGIAAVVLVAIMLVLGAVLSFSAAAKGAKRSSPSSSRVRGRQRYEESEGESST